MPQQLNVEFSNKNGNTQIQVYRNNNGVLIAFGNPYTPGTALPTNNIGEAKHNLAVQFGEFFYCSAGNEIRRYNPSTGDWDVEVLAYASSSIHSDSLLVGTGPTGTPRLAVVFRGVSNLVEVRTLDIPGGTWAATVITGLTTSSVIWPTQPPVVVNNQYLVSMRGEVAAWSFDGSGASKQLVGGAGAISVPVPHSITRVGSRLFALAFDNGAATTYFDIWERIGGTWALVLSGLTNEVMPRVGGALQTPNGFMLYDKAAASLVVLSHLDSNSTPTLGFPGGVGILDTNPGNAGNGLHAVQIPISMIGKGVIGPDAGTGFAITGTTITRNDGGSWLTDGVEIGSLLRLATALDAGNVATWGPVTGVTAGLVTIASATFTPNANDTTVTFFLRERNLTGTIIPGGLQAPGGVDPLGDSRFAGEVDAETDPFNPLFYIWACPNNTLQQRYQYNGVATPLSILGAGGDRGIALNHNPLGGGEGFYAGSTTLLPAFHVEEAGAPIALPNASRIFLRGKIIDESGGAPTPEDKAVGLFFSADDSPTPDVLGTILNVAKVSGPGNAPSLSANKITMTFDNVSIYSAEWQAVTDGLVDQDLHQMMPRAEV